MRVGRWEVQAGVLHSGSILVILFRTVWKENLPCKEVNVLGPSYPTIATLRLGGIFHGRSEEDPNNQPARKEYGHKEPLRYCTL